MLKRCVLYARRSSEGGESDSIDGQLARMRDFAAKNNLQIVTEISEEKSGIVSFEKRPEGRKVLQLAKSKTIDIVLVDVADRLHRDLRIYLQIYDTLADFNVSIIDARTGDVLGDNLIDIIKAVQSQEERKNIARRMSDGKKRKAGRTWIGFAVPYGYTKVGTGRDASLTINNEQANTIRDIFNSYNSGVSQNEIVDRLNRRGDLPAQGTNWTRIKVFNIIKNEFYTGTYHNFSWQCESFYDNDGKKHTKRTKVDSDLCVTIPAIISVETYQKSVEMRKHNKTFSNRNATFFYLLSSRVTCMDCGASMCGSSHRSKDKTRHYYSCTARRHKKSCSNPYFDSVKTDEAVWKWIANMFMDTDVVQREYEKQFAETSARRQELQQIIDKYTKKMQRVNSELERAFLAFTKDIVSEELYTRTKMSYDSELASYEKIITETQGEIDGLNSLTEDDVLTLRDMWLVVRNKIDRIGSVLAARKILADRLGLQVKLGVIDGKKSAHITCKIGEAFLSLEEDDKKNGSNEISLDDFTDDDFCDLSLEPLKVLNSNRKFIVISGQIEL